MMPLKKENEQSDGKYWDQTQFKDLCIQKENNENSKTAVMKKIMLKDFVFCLFNVKGNLKIFFMFQWMI